VAGPLTPTGALRAWYSIGVVLVAAVLVVVMCVVYIGHVQERADRRWCVMLAIQAAESPEPSTPRGKSTQAEAQRLSQTLDCPDLEKLR